ncbi:MAG: nucleotide exchange factor GrpE [Chloroflexi bacterium]|nr:nucleotide exchange factor GrpE [Chloroflexota bacterium]|tara:strand:- start:7562 stop:8095 length:534 start_codon:yes stop_codon:yes gene_type:complete
MSNKKKEKKLSKSEVEINDLKKERDDFKNIAARAQADLVNYRNRMKVELSEIESRGKKTVSLKVLSVIDEFDLALEGIVPIIGQAANSEAADIVIDGLDIIREKFKTTFESENISEITEVKIFDPVYHEALITTETDKYEPGAIIKILRKGYIMNDEVIRPAQVEIAKEKNEEKEKK